MARTVSLLCAASALSLLLSASAAIPAALAADDTAPFPPPGQLFNLTGWKLQLPIPGSGGKDVMEILLPELATYTSKYFNSTGPAPGGRMRFCAPDDGATTGGSKYPRSELRNLDNWCFGTGKHTFNATTRVVKQPQTGKTIIGQAHFEGLSGTFSIVIMCVLWREGGGMVNNLRCLPRSH